METYFSNTGTVTEFHFSKRHANRKLSTCQLIDVQTKRNQFYICLHAVQNIIQNCFGIFVFCIRFFFSVGSLKQHVLKPAAIIHFPHLILFIFSQCYFNLQEKLKKTTTTKIGVHSKCETNELHVVRQGGSFAEICSRGRSQQLIILDINIC